MAIVRDGTPVRLASSSIVAGPAASASNKPTSLATNRCLAAMKPIATLMIGSGVTAAMVHSPNGWLNISMVSLVQSSVNATS